MKLWILAFCAAASISTWDGLSGIASVVNVKAFKMHWTNVPIHRQCYPQSSSRRESAPARLLRFVIEHGRDSRFGCRVNPEARNVQIDCRETLLRCTSQFWKSIVILFRFLCGIQRSLAGTYNIRFRTTTSLFSSCIQISLHCSRQFVLVISAPSHKF